jgi:hypothetical protein
VARKDRERARKRRRIERARRDPETGVVTPVAPKTRPDKPSSAKRPAGAKAGQGNRINIFAKKGEVGDLAPGGLLSRYRPIRRTRDMIIHPRITFRVLVVVGLLGLVGVVLPSIGPDWPWLRSFTFVAFAICFIGLADLAPTKVRSFGALCASALSLSLATAPYLAPPS